MDEDEVYQDHITVDLTGCKYVMEFWERIQSGFPRKNPENSSAKQGFSVGVQRKFQLRIY